MDGCSGGGLSEEHCDADVMLLQLGAVAPLGRDAVQSAAASSEGLSWPWSPSPPMPSFEDAMNGLATRTVQNMVSKVLTDEQQQLKEFVDQTKAEVEKLRSSVQGQEAAKRVQLYGQALAGDLGELLGQWASLHDKAETAQGLTDQAFSGMAELKQHFSSIDAQVARARRVLFQASPSSTQVALEALSEAIVHVDAFSEFVQAAYPAMEERMQQAMMLGGFEYATVVSNGDAQDWANLARQAEQPSREEVQSDAAWPLGGGGGIMGRLAKKAAVKMCYRVVHKLSAQSESYITSLAADTKRDLESVAESMQSGTDAQHRQAMAEAMADSLGSSLEEFSTMRGYLSMVLSTTGSAPALLQEVQHYAGLVQSSVKEAERQARQEAAQPTAAPELEALAAAGRHADAFKEAADKGIGMIEDLIAQAMGLIEE